MLTPYTCSDVVLDRGPKCKVNPCPWYNNCSLWRIMDLSEFLEKTINIFIWRGNYLKSRASECG